MRMQILKNSKGEIVAAYEATPGASVSIEVEPSIGQELDELDVPEQLLRSEEDILGVLSIKLPRDQPSKG
ncbi:hypothetical protein SAMN05216419_10743 [Nitrosomonas cryotolerans]|uniref:Uncharacterized protein n=1 Tax=Nitrosomonas cryotolerans ATCC 49181 TaxID=1131553 RepID=A0A1N6HVL9_9PROT|nr:hypothetical protein [Nitrosomonas cryotolerans]SFQ14418.1 hypothetical protein SAMN05216419_10743 [Nitrosomonas cryotolerans]SIO23796.1 hypothetical protein SAMN02743940_1385 [Nitrosomonas cryotolerans ATCC 49181]